MKKREFIAGKMTLVLSLVFAVALSSTSFAKTPHLKPHHINGVVVTADATAKTITVKDKDAQSIVISVLDSTKIKEKSKAKTFADIVSGDNIAVKYTVSTTGNFAQTIKILPKQSQNIEGNVTAIDATAKTITVEDNNALSIVISVQDSTIITEQDQPRTFADIILGDNVVIKFTVSSSVNLAETIKILPEASHNINGNVTAIDATAKTITAMDKDAQSILISVQDSTKITERGLTRAFSDVAVGDAVVIKYTISSSGNLAQAIVILPAKGPKAKGAK